jgi:hypothetical protein
MAQPVTIAVWRRVGGDDVVELHTICSDADWPDLEAADVVDVDYVENQEGVGDEASSFDRPSLFPRTGTPADPLEVFLARASARSTLVEVGEMEPVEAVAGLVEAMEDIIDRRLLCPCVALRPPERMRHERR